MSDNMDMPLDADPQEVAASTTNDPRAAYGKKREPMLSNETLTIIGLKAAETKYGLHEQCMAIVAAISGVYEQRIASGELIVKSELVAFLNTEDAITSSGNQLRQDILDRFNKKTS